MKYPIEKFFTALFRVVLFLLSLNIVFLINMASFYICYLAVSNIGHHLVIYPLGGLFVASSFLSIRIYNFFKFGNFMEFLGFDIKSDNLKK